MHRRRSFLVAAIATAACAAQTLQAAAQASKAPAQDELFLFIYRPGPAWRSGVPMNQQGLGPHAAYMQRLLNEGRLFAGGGFAEEGGMAIVIAADIAQASDMLAVDPAITSGIFVATLENWRPRFRTDNPLPGGRPPSPNAPSRS